MMNGEPNPGLTIRRLYKKIDDDARKMLLARVSYYHYLIYL